MSQSKRAGSILVDSNEAETPTGQKVISFFRSKFPQIQLLVSQAVADYVFPSEDGYICVERSTPADLYEKLISGRAYTQVMSEREACYRLYYAVVDYRSLPKLIQQGRPGAMTEIERGLAAIGKFGAIIVPIWSASSFPSWLAQLYSQEAMGKIARIPGRVMHKKKRTPCEIASDVLMSLPGVGKARAREILRKWGTLGAALRAILQEPRVLEALGLEPEDIQKLVEALHMPCD